MEEVMIVRKIKDPKTGIKVDYGYPQKVKRGSHGRFTHYVPLKKAIDEGISFLIGLAFVIGVGCLGYYLGLKSCIESAIISPLP